jgi:serine/threonine protein kinase
MREAVPVYAIEQLPEQYSAGVCGNVYRVDLPNSRKAVFKIDKSYIRDKNAHGSFKTSLSFFRTSCEVQKSRHYADCYGLIYIKELNLWGTIYECLGGTHPTNFDRNTLIKIAEGLKFLDEQGVPHTDLKNSNILIHKDGTAMFFDDVYEKTRTSKDSKSNFGYLVYTELMNKNKECGRELEEFVKDIENKSWDEIIQNLKRMKRLF